MPQARGRGRYDAWWKPRGGTGVRPTPRAGPGTFRRRPIPDPGIAGEVASGVRAALDAVIPDPFRSHQIDRLDERGRREDGTHALGPITLAPGAAAVVVDYPLRPDEPLAYISEWWHDLEIDGIPNADAAALALAWTSVETTFLRNGAAVPDMAQLVGQRSHMLRPSSVSIKLRGGETFAISMLNGAGAGDSVIVNAGFRGHTA